jgi:LmbE family N-acetylglucosaminyl deacetylase
LAGMEVGPADERRSLGGTIARWQAQALIDLHWISDGTAGADERH